MLKISRHKRLQRLTTKMISAEYNVFRCKVEKSVNTTVQHIIPQA